MTTILDKYIDNETKCFKNYMKLKGFIGIARQFKSGHEITFNEESINKSCNVSGKPEIEKLLIKLGEFRKFTVKNLFDLALENIANDANLSIEDIKKQHFFIEAGSTNVTSDYDITISGPYCSQVIKHMFEIYYDQFQTVLPVGFDSNLYPGTASFTTIDGLHSDFATEGSPPKGFLHIPLNIGGQYGEKTMLLPIITKVNEGTNDDASTIQNYQWACSKLHDGLSQLYDNNYESLVDSFNNFKSFLADGKKISDFCKDKFCKMPETDDTNTHKLTIEANSLKKSYTDMWTHCDALDKYYREGLKSTLPHERMSGLDELKKYINTPLGYSNLVAWLCSEAYYSSFTVYAIVVCLQLGYSGDGFITDIWLVAIIENLADLIKHMLHTISHSEQEHNNNISENEYKKMYITYSKYYYRIYYCLTQYYSMVNDDKKPEAEARLEKLEKALARRKDFDITQANADNIWGEDCLNITNIEKPRDWLRETATDLISNLNSIIPKYNQTGGKRKKKTRKGKRSKKIKRKRKNRSKKRKIKKI